VHFCSIRILNAFLGVVNKIMHGYPCGFLFQIKNAAGDDSVIDVILRERLTNFGVFVSCLGILGVFFKIHDVGIIKNVAVRDPNASRCEQPDLKHARAMLQNDL